MQDEVLIARFCGGSDKAFTKLYHRYKPRILGLLYSLVGDNAEDVCHDVFLKVIVKVHSFDSDKASFGTWIYQIAKNTGLNHLARRQQNKGLDAIHDLQAPESHRLYLNEIRSMIEGLPRVYADTLILYAYRGFSYHEIADIEGVREGTVKSRLNRARSYIA